MTTLVETDSSQIVNLSDLKTTLQEEVQAELKQQAAVSLQNNKKPDEAATVQEQEQQPDDVDASLPVKLRGKTREEIAAMYGNLESSYGRMANDLGQQRVLTDRLLDLKRETDLAANGGTVRVPDVKSSDLLDNPGKTISEIIDARLKQEREAAEAAQRNLAAQNGQVRFMTEHADYQTFVGSPEFQKWVAASPIRQRAANTAAGGDWDTATDLLTEYKQSKAAKAPATDLDKARNASLESGNSKGTPRKEGKIYRRTDLLALKARDPDAYYDENFQAVILKAYAEGRVR